VQNKQKDVPPLAGVSVGRESCQVRLLENSWMALPTL
jgi:hypothetical protein